MKKYEWLNKESRKFLARDYLVAGETAEDRIKCMKDTLQSYYPDIPDIGERFDDYMAKGYYILSSPIWSNYGNNRGFPISCFGSYVEDTMESILLKHAEVGMMTKYGGGTSAYFGNVRGRGAPISGGGESTGAVHFMELYNNLMNVVSQGTVRRGSMAMYLPVDHPDLYEFLKIKGVGSPIQNLSIGVSITDEWMESMVGGDRKKRTIWGDIIKKRFESGYPYIFFHDNVNNGKPDVYKDKDMTIWASNLCAEIMLPSTPDESFVCDLGCLNADKMEDIRENPDIIRVLVYLLDSVMTEFINKTEGKFLMSAPRKFAINHRALGMGLTGWHTALQRRSIPFESMDAKLLNASLWKFIRKEAYSASAELAEKYGEPPLMVGYGRRNSTLLACPPNTSSSAIMGQISPSIEPLKDNYFVKILAKGNITYRNPVLAELLKEKGRDQEEVWKSILMNDGSVQHLDFLTPHEKEVFKTFREISQKEIIIQAAQRQAEIDQGQSLNLAFASNTRAKDVSELMIFAWEQKIKSLYYQRNTNPSQELARNIHECKSCQ